MTETSPAVSHVVKGTGKHESVGGPIPNTEMKVVHSETRSSLAARQTGEICMRGPQVRERESERERGGERERGRELLVCSFPYLVLVLLFYVTTVVATSCRLTYLSTSPTQPTAHMLSDVSAVSC